VATPGIWPETVRIVSAELTGAEAMNVAQDVLLPVWALAMPSIANMNPSCRNFLVVFLAQDHDTESRILQVDTRTVAKITLACRHGNVVLLEAQLPGPVTGMIAMEALAVPPHGLLVAVLVDPHQEAITMDTDLVDTQLPLPRLVPLPGNKQLRHLHLAVRTMVVMVGTRDTLILRPDILLHLACHPTTLALELLLRLLPLAMCLHHRSVFIPSPRDIDTNENSRRAMSLLLLRECSVADVHEIRLT
jgi:hypothetical protein